MRKKIISLFKKVELYHLLAITFLTLCMVYLFTFNGGIFGSTVDWLSQHSVIPEYFRQQFYKSGNIISQFAMNFGAGQNAFNYIYHGYLTPIVLISYFLPFVPMKSYIIGSTVVVLISTLFLFYFWIQKKGVSKTTALCTSILFLFSTSFFYHSHKQIMFIQYMPFLMLALIGVDRMFLRRKRGLLIVSVFLMLMTNYFFSVSGILILSVYAIYEFMTINPDFTAKEFIKAAVSYALAIINAALLTAFALFPAFFAVLSGRQKSTAKDVTSLSELIIPTFKVDNFLYFPYGMGLTCISLIAIFSFLVSKKKNRVFLSVSILILSLFPLITYALNMLLYDNSKIYIPFIPVVLMMTATYINEIFKEHKKFNVLTLAIPAVWVIFSLFTNPKLYIAGFFALDTLLTIILIILARKFKNPMMLILPVILLAWSVTIFTSSTDDMIKKSTAKEIYNPAKECLVRDSLKDEEYLFRSNDLTYTHWTSNYIYCDNYFQTGLYSSIYNKNYHYFTHQVVNLSNTTVNDISVVNINDWLFNRFMGVKYILGDGTSSIPRDYHIFNTRKNYSMYKNNDVYSVIFGSSKLMSIREFNNLSAADRKMAVLGYIIVDDDTLPDVYESPLTKLNLEFTKKDGSPFSLAKDGHIKLKKNKFISADISSLPYDCYIVEITLPDYPENQTHIGVNGIVNAISSRKNAFPKTNFTFSYVITSNEDFNSINIDFYGGNYDIESIVCYGFNSSDINKLSNNIVLSSDTSYISDNCVEGTIYMEEDGYINITIPYDNGFSLYIDDEKVPCEITDAAFVGGKISSGTHKISLRYNTPGLNYGIVISILGILLFISILVYDHGVSKLGVLSVRKW